MKLGVYKMHGIKSVALHGQAASVDKPVVEAWFPEFSAELREFRLRTSRIVMRLVCSLNCYHVRTPWSLMNAIR